MIIGFIKNDEISKELLRNFTNYILNNHSCFNYTIEFFMMKWMYFLGNIK
jgi:hypothetical protein